MLNYAKLADISKWQGDIDYNVFSSQDLSGVIARAGSINYITGVPYTDYKFEINADKCAEHFDVLGFYWFWRANQDPTLQAKYFCDLIKYKKWNIPPVADVEAFPVAVVLVTTLKNLSTETLDGIEVLNVPLRLIPPTEAPGALIITKVFCDKPIAPKLNPGITPVLGAKSI